MENQTTNTFLMVQPVAFAFNRQTAANNHFQQQDDVPATAIHKQALEEFNRMTATLTDNGIHLVIAVDTPEPHTPDSVFPSNWVSFHGDGTVVLYPMFAKNRRLERRRDILEQIGYEGFTTRHIVDYSRFETEQQFLEGTGSMVLDRTNHVAYAALSERTSNDLFLEFCSLMQYVPVTFRAYQQVGSQRLPVYHTNVMMSVWEDFAVVCLEAVDDELERKHLVDLLRINGKEIVEISEEQMCCFAGNMIRVENNAGERFLVMSGTACRSLSGKQLEILKSFNPLIMVDIPTIEKYGGGSVRCMMSEIFLPIERQK